MAAIDLLGQRFGKLLVIDGPFVTRPYGKALRRWLSKCDCGTWRIIPSSKLTDGNTKSCGCLRKETCAKLGSASKPRLDKGENGFNTLFAKYRHSATSRNLSFDLSKVEFRQLTKQNCYYCDTPPSRTKYGSAKRQETKEFGGYLHSGIDRLDSSLGYTAANCVPCCTDCNLAKQSLSHDRFIELVHLIARKHA